MKHVKQNCYMCTTCAPLCFIFKLCVTPCFEKQEMAELKNLFIVIERNPSGILELLFVITRKGQSPLKLKISRDHCLFLKANETKFNLCKSSILFVFF